jgi:hypothetical protein
VAYSAAFKKWQAWQKAYSKINAEMNERGLRGFDRLVYYQKRIQEFKQIIV